MDNKKIYTIDKVNKILINKYQAVEIDGYDILNSINYSNETIKDIVKTYKIEDESIIQSILSIEEKEELEITLEYLDKNREDADLNIMFDDMHKITTGKLVVIMLESEDNIHLTGFIMHGNGQKLYDYLSKLIGENLEKNYNNLDETISELKNFRPYGKYFK